ncbi:MAG: ADOP family duplicated permease [Vicinamibacterales bacterium]
MERPDHEVAPRSSPLSSRHRAVVRLLAPRAEREDILADLEDEAREIADAGGRRAAARFLRWHLAHSALPWLARRGRDSVAHLRRLHPMRHTGLVSDVRLAARRLRQAPAFSALAIATLAIGIGAVSTVFSLAWAVWLKPLPFAEPDRLAWIHALHVPTGSRASLSGDELADLSRDPDAFSGIAGFSYGAMVARVGDEPVRVVTHRVSPNLFRVLGVHPALGRDLSDADAGAPVLVLSDAFWTRRFNRDPAVVGRTITMGDEAYQVVGVMPRGFVFPRVLSADAWIASRFEGSSRRFVEAVGRLAPGRTLASAGAEVDARARRRAAGLGGDATEWTVSVSPADVTASASSRLAYQTLLGLVALFLVIGCTNLAGLLLARNTARRGELAVCLSLGASRWRLARALVAESAMLTLAGCAGGLGLAAYGTRIVSAVMPAQMAGLQDIGLNLPVVGAAAGVALVAAAMVGLLSALGLRSLRSSEAITGARAAASGVTRAQRGFVVVEIVLAVVLLVGASAMVRSFGAAVGRDRGYDPRGLQALNVSLPFSDDSYEDTTRRARAFDEMIARVTAVPGVRLAAATTGFPGSRLGILGGAPLQPTDGGDRVIAALHAASPGYFETMGTPVRGRAFTPDDTTTAPRVAIVNARLARLFPDGNPVGHRIPVAFFGNPPESYEIVGVAGDIMLGTDPGYRVFVPLAQVSPYWIDLVFRADTGPAAMPAVRQALRGLSGDLLIENAATFDAIISDSLALERAQSAFAAMVGALSAIVAGIGLYALMSFVAARRRREFGIRLALGSPPRRIFREALGRALRLVGAGLVTGLAASALLVRALGSLVFGLASADLRAYALALALVLVVALVAVWLPARRAMRVDPLVALRTE